MAQPLTTAEVAALVGLDEKRIRKDVEHGFFGAKSPPRFAFPALVYCRAVARLGFDLGVADRRKVYRMVKFALSSGKRPEKVEVSPICEVNLGAVVEEMTDKLARFDAWKKQIVVDDRILGGEPVFPKSRLSVRHVGAMVLRGATVAEIREDYSYLTDEDIELAKLYIQAYPRPGRPREHEPDEAPAR
jgi:uncharacterized protein (DUF433 family)